jgi:hypothetical protein
LSSDRAPQESTRSAAITWLALTLFGAVSLTAFDAVLLERKKGFLTGGFLAEDHVTTFGQLLSFVTASIIADAAVIGVLAAFGLWLFASLRRPVRYAGALVIAMLPLVIADFVSYQLLDYLGDAFDLTLMYELADGQPSELFAVASGPVTFPLLALSGVAAAFVAGVWMLRRRRSLQADTSSRVVGLRVPAALFIAGVVATTAASATDDVLDNGLRRKPSGNVLNYLARQLSDFDGDGYAAVGRLADPSPFDARITPLSTDIPGNGIDENGVGGDLPAGSVAYVEDRPPSRWTRRPNVVLIMLESFRADVVGAHRNGRAVTPTLDALASRGVSAQRAYSHNGYTVQSRHHVFSGTLANLGDGTTLVDDFKANGYEVAWVSGQDESFGANDLKVGFDRADLAYDARTERHRRYSTFTTPGSLAVPYEVVVEQIGRFLDSRTTARPLFLYVNFHDTHFPYHHDGIRPLVGDTVIGRHQIAPSRAAEVQAMYANTAANVDAAIGEVLRLVEQALGVEPGVVVIGDHGESLFDENFLGHGYALNDAQTRIPLIVANLPLIIDEPFGQADLRAALRAALEPSPPGLETSKPTVRTNGDKGVFQYLGTIDRPRQIAFATLTDRVVFDFRTNKGRIAGGSWVRINNLPAPDRDRVVELIRYWERMKLARTERLRPDKHSEGDDSSGL